MIGDWVPAIAADGAMTAALGMVFPDASLDAVD